MVDSVTKKIFNNFTYYVTTYNIFEKKSIFTRDAKTFSNKTNNRGLELPSEPNFYGIITVLISGRSMQSQLSYILSRIIFVCLISDTTLIPTQTVKNSSEKRRNQRFYGEILLTILISGMVRIEQFLYSLWIFLLKAENLI